jgi:hypothetical protein
MSSNRLVIWHAIICFVAFSCQDGFGFQKSCWMKSSPFRLARSELHLEAQQLSSRRSLISNTFKGLVTVTGGVLVHEPLPVRADDEQQFDPDDPEFREMYNNPAMPPSPEERSGLVVLRVAEVAQFQEKILRAIVDGDLKGVTVSPMQFAFGTQILLRNSNLDGNMKLMINEEIPKQNREKAIKNAVKAMNTLQEIGKFAGSIQREFEPLEMVALADMYKTVRINLNQLYEWLPQKEREKYYGYFVQVTEYEKKIADGTYNPDIDGILKFD